MMGLNAIPCGTVHVPPMKTRWRMSKACPPVVLGDIVGIHRDTGIAARVAERIEPEQVQLGAHPQVEVRDQLVLIEDTGGLD